MKYQLIRNATAKLHYGNTCFLLDPAFAKKGSGPSYAGEVHSPLVDLPCKMWQAESGADCVVVSHIHSDHFDQAAAEALDKDRPIFVQPWETEHPLLSGFEDIRPLDSSMYNEVAFQRVEAVHGSSPEILSDMGRTSGVVFMAAGEPTVYWAGDTVFCGEVRKTIDIYQPEVIIVHAGGAVWKGEKIIMDEAQVLALMKYAPEAEIIAVHMECCDHCRVARQQLQSAADAAGMAGRLYIPADGEAVEIALKTAF